MDPMSSCVCVSVFSLAGHLPTAIVGRRGMQEDGADHQNTKTPQNSHHTVDPFPQDETTPLFSFFVSFLFLFPHSLTEEREGATHHSPQREAMGNLAGGIPKTEGGYDGPHQLNKSHLCIQV
jgi:hypothetical protein